MNSSWKGKTLLIAGLGDSGWAAQRYLAAAGARLRLADTRVLPPGIERLSDTDLPTCFGAFDARILEGVAAVIKSPGLPQDSEVCLQARARGIPVIGDIEVFARELATRGSRARIIAITGSNGKSTVTELCGQMCQAAGVDTVVAGNIGLPVLDVLLARQQEPDVYVLELSSFQLEDTSSLKPDAATVLNISEDHMDRYADLASYAAAKARIFAGRGTQVLNRDDVWTMGMRLARPVVTFGLNVPHGPNEYGLRQQNGETWLARDEALLLPLDRMRIRGLHNAANAMAALALCQAIGVEMAPLLQALREFAGLPHRVQWVAELDGVEYYDDSKGTNVGATQAALSGLGRKAVLIAGGDGKGQDFSPLKATVQQYARAVLLIGRDADQISAAIAGCQVAVERLETLEMAVFRAAELARPGDAVLLSPACASWDMFRNYAHRAEVFVAAVRHLEASR